MVAQSLQELPTLTNGLEEVVVVAKSARSGEPVFTSMDALLVYTDHSIETGDIKRKKGSQPLL
jgi:hypothetical protein